jgi:hypothetical protein
MKIPRRYIYPPRPLHDAVPRNSINMYQKMDWWAQIKYNDKRTVISLFDGMFEMSNRHRDKHKTYNVPGFLHDEILEAAQILGLESDHWHYLDGGLLHGKHKIMRDTIVIWDILVRNDEWLVGSTYKDRYKSLISGLDNTPFIVDVNGQACDFGVKITDHIFIPKIWRDYDAIWKFVDETNEAACWKENDGGEPLLEGVMLKAPNGKLKISTKENNNTDWSVRSRVKTGRHLF